MSQFSPKLSVVLDIRGCSSLSRHWQQERTMAWAVAGGMLLAVPCRVFRHAPAKLLMLDS